MQLKIFFDTNIISKGDFDEIRNLTDFLNENESFSKVELHIPEIVLLEWQKHQRMKVEAINKRAVDSLKELESLGHPKIEIKKINPNLYAKETTEKYLTDFNLRVIPVPEINKDELTTRAIEKISPFNTKKEGSDFGFKDTLLFFSIREEAKLNHKDDTVYILMTNDGGFTDAVVSELKKEGKELLVIGDMSKLKDELDVRLKLGLGLSQKRAAIEKLIAQKREVFDLFLLVRAPREMFVTVVNRENVEGYSFSSFYLDDFDETSKDNFKVSGRIIADISYKKTKPEERKDLSVWGGMENPYQNVHTVYAIPSISGVASWGDSILLQQHESFWVNLDVNLASGDIRIS